MSGSRVTKNSRGFYFKVDEAEDILLRKHAELLGYPNVSEFIRQRTIYDFQDAGLDYTESRKYPTRIRLSLQSDECRRLYELASSQNCSVSEFVRRFIIGDEKMRTVILNRDAILDVFQELRRQGVNLNQIAKIMNSHGVNESLVLHAVDLIEEEIDKIHYMLEHLVAQGGDDADDDH